MAKIVDSYRLHERVASPSIEDMGNREGNLGSKALTAFVDLAIDEIESGIIESENISAALSVIAYDPLVLGYAPIAPVNNFVLKNFLNELNNRYPIVGDTRVIGCGVLPIEATSMLYSRIKKDSEKEVLELLKHIKDIGIKRFIENRLNKIVPQTDNIIETTPIIDGIIHFSDPVWDPIFLNPTRTEPERRKEFEVSLPRQIFIDASKVFWGRLLRDVDVVTSNSANGVFTADSVQSLRELNSPVENLFALKFDPEMLNKVQVVGNDTKYEIYANIREALNQFYELIVKQVKSGGLIVITLGKGNNTSERLNRRIFAITLSRLLPSTAKTTILEPEEYVGGVIGIPKSIFKTSGDSDMQYLSMRMPSELIAFNTGNDLESTFFRDIGRNEFQKIVYKAKRDTERLSQLIR